MLNKRHEAGTIERWEHRCRICQVDIAMSEVEVHLMDRHRTDIAGYVDTQLMPQLVATDVATVGHV